MTHLFKNILNTNLSAQAESFFFFLPKLFEMKNVNKVMVKLFTHPKEFYIAVHFQKETPFFFNYFIWLFSQ